MLVFLDESFRTNRRTGNRFGVLAGAAIPEDIFHTFQADMFGVRGPYHGEVLKPDDEIHGVKLLNRATLRSIEKRGFSQHWNLAEDILRFSRSRDIKVFGVVCFREDLHSFVCGDELRLDVTYRYLFERVDRYMKREFPGRMAKLVFDNREHRTHERNARAITNFFTRSQLGLGYDSILRVPFFAVSQGHNYGLQLADLITTVIGLFFQQGRAYRPLWEIVRSMLYVTRVGGRDQTSLKTMRNVQREPWRGR